MSRRLALPLGVALLALLAPMQAFGAGTVDYDATFDEIEYVGDANANVVTFTDAAGPAAGQVTLTVAEAGIALDGSVPECTDNGDTVTCTVTTMTRVRAFLQGGADVATNNATILRSWLLSGNEGDDELTGSDSADVFEDLFGGPGTDDLSGRGGPDRLAGGGGDGDLEDGGGGRDTFDREGTTDGSGDLLRGGPGFDSVRYTSNGTPPSSAVIDLAAGSISETDGSNAATLESIEDAFGDEGADRLVGTNGANSLSGSSGNDEIDGLAGADTLDGSEGDDTLLARDGVNDRVFGDDGTDTCLLDQLDDHSGCESAQIAVLPPFGVLPQPAPPAPAAADQSGPVCSTSGLASRMTRDAVIARGVGFTATCDEPGRIEADLTGRVTRLPTGVLFSAVGDLTFGTTRRALGAGNRVRARLRVTRRLRRSIRRVRRLRIEIRAADALGNPRTMTRTIRLR